MSTKLEHTVLSNKQMTHIIGETIVALGIVFWFSSKTKKLSSYIEELSQRLEDQEDHIQKIENSVNILLSQFSNQPKVVQPKVVQPKVVQPKVVRFINKIEHIEEEDESDSDIDNQIKIELEELELDTSLKKQN